VGHLFFECYETSAVSMQAYFKPQFALAFVLIYLFWVYFSDLGYLFYLHVFYFVQCSLETHFALVCHSVYFGLVFSDLLRALERKNVCWCENCFGPPYK